MNELMGKVSTLSIGRIAVFGFLITLVYYVAWYNTGETLLAEMQSLQGQIASESTKKADTERILKKEEEMRADVASLAKTYEAVKSKIPIDFESSELRIIIEQISAATNFKIIKLTNEDARQSRSSSQGHQDANLVKKVAISYIFQGNFSQLQDFISQVSVVEKIIQISNLKIRTENGTNGPSQNLKVEATLVGYRQATVATDPVLPGATPKGRVK